MLKTNIFSKLVFVFLILLWPCVGSGQYYLPIGTGTPHVYNGIPFEVGAVGPNVVHYEGGFVPSDTLDLTGYRAQKIHVIQYCYFATNVSDGVTVGQINIHYADTTLNSLDLVIGQNTAEWAYDRPEVQHCLQHTKIPPAYSFLTNKDSEFYYWAHFFYVSVTTLPKAIDYLELVLDPGSYTGQPDGCDSGSWFGISINAITLEVEKTLVVKDGSASHSPIADKTFKIYKAINNPPAMTEIYLGELTTDGNGKITIPEGWLNTGDSIKVERVVHTEPAVKHKNILPNMYYIKIDNGKFDSTTGAMYYDTLTTDAEQEVIIDHTTIMYDLLASVEWDADQQYLESLRDGFRLMSNYLHDVTDGQMYLNKIAIYDDMVNWHSADVHVYASNMMTPHVPNDVDGIWTSGNPIMFPRKWFGDLDTTRNGTYSESPLILTTSVDYRTKCHEFGHYGLGFYDEYLFVGGSRCNGVMNYGFMDYQYDNGEPYASEMSSDSRYEDPSCRNTEQYSWRGASCWSYLENQRQKSISGVYVPIIKPDERQLPAGRDYFEGPNNNMVNLNYDVGHLLNWEINNPSNDARTLIVRTHKSKADVTLKKTGSQRIIKQGQTCDEERIRCLGVDLGDIIEVGKKERVVGRWAWLFGQIVVGASGMSNLKNYYRTSLDGDSVEVILRSVQGDYEINTSGKFDAENSLRYILQTNKSFSQDPSLVLYSPSGQVYSYDFSPVTNGYEVTIGDSLGRNGMFSVVAVDDSGYSFFINNSYTVAYLSDSLFSHKIYGSEGACELGLDTLNTSLQKMFILSSDFPPLLNGLDSLVEQGGEVHALSAYPNISDLSGEGNYLVIRYSDSDLKDGSETSLKIFKWNESSDQWEWIDGVIDTIRNEVVTPIQSLGIYAAFTTALIRGDVNSDGKRSVSDVVYLINYLFKGGPQPVGGLLLADVNCDGKVSVSDVVYLINYLFKGGTPPAC